MDVQLSGTKFQPNLLLLMLPFPGVFICFKSPSLIAPASFDCVSSTAPSHPEFPSGKPVPPPAELKAKAQFLRGLPVVRAVANFVGMAH